MYHATGEQACEFIGAAAEQPVPADVLFAWAATLRTRWLQRPLRQGSARAPRTPDGKATFRAPPVWQ
jgi:hypothetical protein